MGRLPADQSPASVYPKVLRADLFLLSAGAAPDSLGLHRIIPRYRGFLTATRPRYGFFLSTSVSQDCAAASRRASFRMTPFIVARARQAGKPLNGHPAVWLPRADQRSGVIEPLSPPFMAALISRTACERLGQLAHATEQRGGCT